MDVSLLVGKIMLESGVEMYWVEDIMMWIVVFYGIKKFYSYVMLIGIMFLFEMKELMKMKLICIFEWMIDLKKVIMVNSVLRIIS